MPPSRKFIVPALLHFGVASIGLVGLLSPDHGSPVVVGIIVLLWLAALALLLQVWRTGGAPRFLGRVTLRPLRMGLLLAVAIASVLLIALVVPVSQLPARGWFVPFLLFYPWSLLSLFVYASDQNRQRLSNRFANALLLFISLTLSLGALEFLLRRIPDRFPRDVIRFVPSETFGTTLDKLLPVAYHWQDGGKVVQTTWSELDGSLIQISCFNYPPDFEPEVVSLDYARDPYGFRNTWPWPDEVSLIVLGDSFTDATFIPEPYWYGLTDDQLILGYPGTGTMDQRFLYQVYGQARNPDVVLLTFFEGNDAFDNNLRANQLLTDQKRDYALLDLSLTTHLIRKGIKGLSTKILASQRVAGCPYPVTDAYGNEVGLYPPHLGSLVLDRDAMLESGVFDATRSAMLGLAADVQASGATFVVVYMPTKEHVHWDGLRAAGVADQLVDTSEVAAAISANKNTQSELIADLAAEHGFLYFDLTPAFTEATTAGQSLYCYTDDHLCQPGHHLARQVIRDFMQANQLLP